MIRGLAVLLSTVLACEAQQRSPAVGGQISGAVKGDDGSSVAGASVYLKWRLPEGAPLRQRTEWTATTDAAGLFHFDLLTNGQYAICVQAPLGNWLNPCEWGTRRPTVTVSPPLRSANVTIVLKRGAVVPIRVDDPSQLLAQNEGKTRGAHLLLGVRSDALIFHAASVTSQDSGGRNYAITVPHDVAVKLVVASSFFRLTDATGAAVAASGAGSIPVSVPSGKSPATVLLSVSGHR